MRGREWATGARQVKSGNCCSRSVAAQAPVSTAASTRPSVHGAMDPTRSGAFQVC
jgi:hypothetical protein